MWFFETKKGTFYIKLNNNQYNVFFENEDLGSYLTPNQAADDLSGGHTYWPSSGFDPSELNIPSDIGDWEKM